MPMQGAMNVVLRGLLSTPGVAGGIGKRLITLYVVGRKSGKRYNIPVAYSTHDSELLVATSAPWGRNLRTGEPLEVKYKGRRRSVDVEVVKDEPGVVALFDFICRDNKNFAKFNKVGFDSAGDPKPEDLQTAWRNGGRVFKLTLR